MVRLLGFILDIEEQMAVNILERSLVTPPAMALSRLNGKYKINTGVYNDQDRCILLQEQEEKALKSIGNWSCELCDEEIRYDTTLKESQEEVWVAILMRPYLKESRLIIRTDYQALR